MLGFTPTLALPPQGRGDSAVPLFNMRASTFEKPSTDLPAVRPLYPSTTAMAWISTIISGWAKPATVISALPG